MGAPRTKRRKLFLAVITGTLVLALSGCALTGPAETSGTSGAKASKISEPPAGKLYHGVFPGSPNEEDEITPDDVSAYERAVGRSSTWIYFSHNWFRDRRFPRKTAAWIWERGSVPFIRLMLRSSEEQNIAEPEFTLDRIIRGRFDRDLRAWARSARDFPSPLLVEFGTEVNGNWFSWNGDWNGGGRKTGYGDAGEADGPERFRDAYRHIVDIMRAEGAKNITWVFHVDKDDVPDRPWNRLENYYPGDQWIDWIGMSVYGAADPLDDDTSSFRELMDEIYPRLAELSSEKPIVLLEFGATSGNPRVDQAAWARSALAEITSGRWPRLIGFAWWNDWWENDDNPRHNTNMYVDDNQDLTTVFRELVGNSDSIREGPVVTKD